MSDRMNQTLTALRGDAEQVPLAAADAVRRRGNQRTRRQAVGVALAGVTLLAGVVGVAGQLIDGDDRAVAPPAVSPTPTPTAAYVALAQDPFLRAGDVPSVGPYENFLRSPQPGADTQRPLECISSPTSWGATETRGQAYYQDLDATFVEHVLRFTDAASARRAAESVAAEFAACDKGDPSEATVEDRGPVGDPGSTFRASRLSTPTADAGIAYYELGATRSENVVVVLEWSSMGNPAERDGGWVWTDARLALAMGRATG